MRAFLNISIGGTERFTGPLAWLAQFMLIRPGPVFGQVFGATSGAAAAAASVAALSLAPMMAGGVVFPAGSDPGTAGAAALTTGDGATQGSAPTTGQPTGPGPTSPAPTTPAPGGPTSTPTPTGPTSTPPTTPTPTGPAGRTSALADTLATPEDVTGSVDVLANDPVASGDSLTVVDVSSASHGTTSVGSAGTVRYVPAADYHGTDTFTYTARNNKGAPFTAAVAVTVTSVNDPPVAVDDNVTMREDSGPVHLDLVSNDRDVDGDALTVTSVSAADHGAVDSTTGGFTYDPAPDFNGTDHISYSVTDGNGGISSGHATITVSPVNDPPAAGPAAYSASVGVRLKVNAGNGVLAGATDVDGDHLSVVSDDSAAVQIAADGSISYLPLLPGVVKVGYVVSDGQATADGTVTITVTLLPTASTELFFQPTDTDTTGALAASTPSNGVDDWDNDGKPGLTVKSSDLKSTEENNDKFQTWSYAVPHAGLHLHGPVTMDLWTSLKGKAHEDLDYAVWVNDCTPSGTCTRVTSAVGVHVTNWSTTTGWEEREIVIGNAIDSIPKDDVVTVRLMFGGTDVWMPLDGAHPTSITFTT